MSKYIELAEQIEAGNPGEMHFRNGQKVALRWLDEHPDQVPGRTIKESEYRHAMLAATDTEDFDAEELLRRLGLTVVPDPEPTNAEKLAQLHDQYTRFPVQHLPGNGSFADYLDHKGVKAPNHD